MKRIPDGTALCRDNQWDIPRKRALFVSDGPGSTTSGSDILEEEYSGIPKSGRPHDGYVAEGLCSPIRQLEKAVVRLQQDIADYRAELKLNRTQTPAVSTWHLDSAPPETPIRDVVDHCSVWESHADPDVRRVSKPSLDPTYSANIVGDADRISETTSVAEVTEQRSDTNQLEDLLRQLRTTVEAPAPSPEVPAAETLLQRLVTDTQSRPPPVVSPPAPTELEQSMRPFLAGQRRRRRRRRRQPCSGKVVTATGDGNTELSPSGCESSSTDRIITVDALIPRGTAPATATATVTVTRPAGLERRVMFLLWEVGSCSNT